MDRWMVELASRSSCWEYNIPCAFFGWRTLPQWDFSKVKGLTPGQLCSEEEGRSGRKDFGTPGLGKMSTFFQK